MRHGIATHVFLQQRLTPALLDTLVRGGAAAIEVFAARHHFDYNDRGSVMELANWFRSNDVAASMHMPLFADETHWTRHTAPTLNLISTNKGTRIASMDEVKRALEAAEQVPFNTCALHLGLKDEQWDTRALDDSLTAIEHLKAFAGPLGVKLLLENLSNDLGHAHMGQGVPATADRAAKSALELAFEAFAPAIDKIASVHVHDNNSVRDEHLWPQQDVDKGYIDWAQVKKLLRSLRPETILSLELAHELGDDAGQVVQDALEAWKLLDA
jgi:sugar phosphate isomerase/epimerase